jgi:hypothetical protein
MSKVFTATEGLETAPLADGAVLYDSKSGNFLMLNRTAAHVWTALTTSKTAEELVQSLCAMFPDVAVSTVQQDVNDCLEHLQALALVSVSAVSDAQSG